jgi:predicted GNAT superfamily acetyltransferase
MGSAAARPEVIGALLERLGDEESYVREAAARALGAMGAAAARPEVIGALLERLGDEDPDVREAAAEALSAYHKQGIRVFGRHFGEWVLRTVSELSEGGGSPRRPSGRRRRS